MRVQIQRCNHFRLPAVRLGHKTNESNALRSQHTHTHTTHGEMTFSFYAKTRKVTVPECMMGDQRGRDLRLTARQPHIVHIVVIGLFLVAWQTSFCLHRPHPTTSSWLFVGGNSQHKPIQKHTIVHRNAMYCISPQIKLTAHYIAGDKCKELG